AYFSELSVIWGGKYPTINPEQTLKECKADFACIGEGLEAFGDFLKALSSNSDNLYKIPNIWGIKGDTVIKNSIRPLKENLDDLPFVDWSIFDKSQFYKPYDGNAYKSGDHMLNWGCPYHCTYCINHLYHEMYDNKYHMRRYSVNRIIEELKFLVSAYSLEFFKFHDEDFLMRPLANLEELSNAYRKEINLPFVIETNPKSVTKEKAALLKNMNCVSASVAIESGDTYMRQEILGRVDSEEDVISAFGSLNEVGIRTSSFNMFALPFETRQSYEKTIALNKKAGVLYPAGCFFYPFEGTKLREVAIEEGFYDPTDNRQKLYELRKPALKFKNLSEQELLAMYQSFVLYVKLPEKYTSYIKRGEKCDDVGEKLRQKIVEIYDKTVWENNGCYIDDGKEAEYLLELEKLCSDLQDNN
ncbi:MAG: hypothetical protein CMB97_00045, partial [Flavobacteriaceae bacterium]|nr:hypothetical protein [Flavobacteriaceae bacterium]